MNDVKNSKSAFTRIDGNINNDFCLICDHASNYVPKEYSNLGLNVDVFKHHIAYDIGAAAVTKGLAAILDIPAVLSEFSRLLIDPNRGKDDPTLIMQISDGRKIPGNAYITAEEKANRIEKYYNKYHQALAKMIDDYLANDIRPLLFSIHSFTPAWKGEARPWHAGVLWGDDDRLAVHLLTELNKIEGLVVGENKPYKGQIEGDTMYVHGAARALPHVLLEIRQDLISSDAGVKKWVDILAKVLPVVARKFLQ